MTANRTNANGRKALSKAQRANKVEELCQLVLAANLRCSELLADDLRRLAQDHPAPDARPLSLAAHRLQLVHQAATELAR